MSITWEPLTSVQRGVVGRRVIVAKTFRMPDGSQGDFEITGDADTRSVACLALTDRDTVVLAEQYRPGPERLMMELPGGRVEPGEALESAARRELAEETGYVADGISFLGDMYYDAYVGGTRSYFLATGCERRQEQELDVGEFVIVHEVGLGEVVKLAMSGQMTDPGGVLLALPFLMKDAAVRELFSLQ